MKTINMFGKRMPIVAILMALLVIGTASAAVVTFLGNEAEANVTVTSPFTVEVSADGGNWILVDAEDPASIDLANVYGGGMSNLWFRYTNLADHNIATNIVSTATCDEGIGHEDFENHLVSNPGDYLYGILLTTVSDNGANVMSNVPINGGTYGYEYDEDTLVMELKPTVFLSGEVIEAHVVFHHAPGAQGTYTITTQVMDDSYEYLDEE